MEKMLFRELNPRDKARLCEVYGPQPETGYAARKIVYVRELTEYEAWFFGSGNFLSPSFFTQTVYKLKGTLLPTRFTRALREAETQDDMLRTNYCDMGERVLAVVCQERKHSEDIVYSNFQGRDPEEINAMLRKSTEAALRYPFDVEKGGLFRIFVSHTGREEYAVVVTAAQIIMDRFDVRAIFREAMGMPAAERRAVRLPFRNVQMEANRRAYWKKLLAAPPSPAPLPWELTDAQPHPYKQRAYRVVLPPELCTGLMSEAQGNRLMMMAFLATAWGLLLQIEGRSHDLCFCLITPDKGAQKDEHWRPFQMVPVRQTIGKEETIGNLVKRQFQQMIVSKPYASLDWEGFGNFLGGGKPFNHFLDFFDFLAEGKPYASQPATPDGNLIAQHSWDAQSMKMSLYFRGTGGIFSVLFLYDEDSFPAGTGERAAQSYLLALQQMMAERQETFEGFGEKLMGRLHEEQKIQKAFREEENARLQHAVSSIGLLQGADAGTTRLFMDAGTLRTYFEGDLVEDMDQDLLFVVEGKLVRSIKDQSGWYCTLNVAKAGAWLNETVLLKEQKADIAAEVLSDRATLLAIPRKAMQNALLSYPGLWQNIANHILSQLENFQRLWAQS